MNPPATAQEIATVLALHRIQARAVHKHVICLSHGRMVLVSARERKTLERLAQARCISVRALIEDAK